jgi:hypothetical protein
MMMMMMKMALMLRELLGLKLLFEALKVAATACSAREHLMVVW